jgi:hypothetical protein
MSIQARRALIAACALFGTVCLMGAGFSLPASAGSSGESSARSLVEGGSLLVEAFVVEVNLPALAKAGVSPIGRQPHSVAVADILTCLDGGQAQVIGGSKVAAQGVARAGAEAETRTYFIHEKEASRRAYNAYEAGGKLAVETQPVTETAVSVQFEFEISRFTQKQPTVDVPPDTERWNWSGSVILPLGSPQIAGAAQNGGTAVLLLLVANACDR